MLAAMMLVPVTSAAASPASKAKNKKKAKTEVVAQESKPAPKKKVSPYDKLMKDVKVSAKGETFSLYRTAKDKIYMELPKKYMGRRIMVGGTITAGSNPSFINVGYKYNKPQYFQIDLTDSLVVLSLPGTNASTSDPLMQEALSRSFMPKILRRIAVAAQSKDSSAVIFDVTGIVNAAAPKGKDFSVAKSAEEKTTWFGELKSFKDNASVKVHANVDFTKSILGFKGKIGSGSMEYTVSFLMLPEKPMPARIQDLRVGVFPVGPSEGSMRYDLSSAEDGYKGYVLASRWRLDLSDTTAWLGGKTVTVKNPIVWYVDMVLSGSRWLDMQNGYTVRKVLWKAPNGKEAEIEIRRMTSFSHLQLFVIDYQVTPVNFSGEVRIESEHQGNVRNYCNPNDPRVAGESFQHLIPDHGNVVNGASYLVTNTATSGLQVCTGVKNIISADEVQTGEIVLEGHHAVQKFTVSAKQGEAIHFVKYMVFADSIR